MYSPINTYYDKFKSFVEMRKVAGELCVRDFKFRYMPIHLEECQKITVSCVLNCGVTIFLEDMTQHLTKECGMMEETCTLGCGVMMPRNELRKHARNTCVKRIVSCKHCQRYLKSCDMLKHRDSCPKIFSVFAASSDSPLWFECCQ